MALRAALALVLFGGAAVVAAHDWVGLGGNSLDGPANGVLYDSVVIAAGIACLLRARAVPRERWAWALIGAAVLCWAAAEVYWTRYILDDPSPPYPSPADALYLAFYPLAYAGLGLLVRARAEALNWRLWADAAIAALATAAGGAVFVFDFVADRTSGSSFEVAISLAYPLGDIAMIAMIIGVVSLTGWRPDRVWALLFAGLAALVVADVAYSIQGVGGVVPAGSWIDPLYLIAAACLGAVLWLPTAAPIEKSDHIDDPQALLVPVIFAALLIAIATTQYKAGVSSFSTVLWAAATAAIFVRLTVSVRENRRLFEQARTDPLTSLLNRGAIQGDLALAAARASVERPVALALYDLNGFKRFNDRFGHPAGDELLVRLSHRLREAIGADGVAYRIGGDEFCVIFTGVPERFDAALKGSAEALTDSGPDHSIGASWGVAWIPGEAEGPSEALRLADVRMYAQKESRRTATELRPSPEPDLRVER